MMPSVLEAVVVAVRSAERDYRNSYGGWSNWESSFVTAVNDVLQQERVGWTMQDDGQMVELNSMELHAEVIEPVLKLLHNSTYANVDSAYKKALDELADGHPDDAITDAGTALQEMLRALGCEGKNLGALLSSAKAKHLLAAHDTPLTTAIEKVIDWVGADRSQLGDSHVVGSPTRADGWLAVHIVGSLIVRLAVGPRA